MFEERGIIVISVCTLSIYCGGYICERDNRLSWHEVGEC